MNINVHVKKVTGTNFHLQFFLSIHAAQSGLFRVFHLSHQMPLFYLLDVKKYNYWLFKLSSVDFELGRPWKLFKPIGHDQKMMETRSRANDLIYLSVFDQCTWVCVSICGGCEWGSLVLCSGSACPKCVNVWIRMCENRVISVFGAKIRIYFLVFILSKHNGSLICFNCFYTTKSRICFPKNTV